MLAWLLDVAWRRLRGDRRPAVSTLTIRGLSYTLDWAASEHVPLREILGRGEYWPTKRFRPGPGQVIVDVGANAGVFATVAASWVGPSGRLVAIEPNPAAAGRLRENLHNNGFDGRSMVIEAGLSDHVGPATLYVGPNSTIGTLSPRADRTFRAIPIQVGSLDGIATEIGLGSIDVLKVDVEGLESTVLDGAGDVLTRCQRVVIEVSDLGDVGAVIDRCAVAGLDRIVQHPSGIDSGATIVYAERGSSDT